MLHISCIIILKCTFSFYCASYLFLRRKIFNLLLRKITFDFCSAIWIRKSVNDFHVSLFNSFSLSHDFSCCEAIKCQHTIFRILTKLRKKYVFPLYIFHFMCMNFSWWSFCIFFYISCAFLMITLYHIKVFSFLQLSLQFLFCWKNWNVDYICRSFWKLNFPAKPKSKPKPQLNQNNHYPGLLSYTRHPPTPSKMIFFFTKYSNFIMDFCYQKKWSQFMIIRFHSANFS